jgi:hypothetical protein
VKRKNKRKKQRMKQEEANASDSRAVEQETTSVAAAGPSMCSYAHNLSICCNNSFAAA